MQSKGSFSFTISGDFLKFHLKDPIRDTYAWNTGVSRKARLTPAVLWITNELLMWTST